MDLSNLTDQELVEMHDELESLESKLNSMQMGLKIL